MVTDTPVAESSVAGLGRPVGLFRRMPAWTAPVVATAVTLVALAPVITVVIQRAGRAYLPIEDPAVIDLRVRDVLTFSRNTPLVGAYSHDGFSHPGPAIFWLSAPFSWLFGNPAWATLIAFALLQGLAIAWTARLAWKTGGLRWTAVWMAVVALSYLATSPSILQRPWNPSVAFPFFILFLLQCWVVARGDPRRLLGLAFVGSFLVQAHIGYAMLVAALGAWALVSLAVRLRREHRRLNRSDVLWPALVLTAMWFPVLVLDPVFDTPSNIQSIVRFFITSPSHPAIVGLSAGLGYLASEFRWLPPWLGGTEAHNRFTGDPFPSPIAWLIGPAVLVVVVGWSWWRSRREELRLTAQLLAVLLVTAGVSLVLVRGRAVPYLFLWRIVAATVTVVLTLTIGVEVLARGRLAPARAVWTAVLVLIVAIGSGSFAGQVAAASGPVDPFETMEASVLAQLHEEGQPAGPVLLRTWGNTSAGLAVGLIDELSREGKPVFVDPSLGFEFGYGRTATTKEVRSILIVVEDSALYTLASSYPGADVIAVSHPLPADQQTLLINLQRQIDRALVQDGKPDLRASIGNPFVASLLKGLPGISPAMLRTLVQLDNAVGAHGGLCSVIAFPPSKWHVGPQPPPV